MVTAGAFSIGLFVICVAHGEMAKGHGSTCTLDFACTSHGTGALVIPGALPRAP